MAAQAVQKVPLGTLTAMVVGGMVGAGVFSIPRNFAQATGVYGALIAWAIAGGGMLMLAFVFQTPGRVGAVRAAVVGAVIGIHGLVTGYITI